MCLATVYEANRDGEPIVKDIAYMIVDGDQVEIETLFGEKKVFQARVRRVDFVKSRVELEAE